MSNSPTTKCYAHYHLSPAEYAVWDVCRALSHDNGILYFSGRNVAARFKRLGKTGAYNLAASLLESGWFKLLKDSQRRRDGTWSPRQYKVLSHTEWAAEHPNSCGLPVLNSDQPVLEEGQDDDSPVLNSDQPVLNSDQPVQASGHNLISTTDKEQPNKQPDYHKPVRSKGLGKLKATLGASARVATPTRIGQPVPLRGQDAPVLDTQKQAEWISTAITNTLGLTRPDVVSEWTAAIKLLFDKGVSAETVQAVAAFAHATFKPGTMQREGAAGFVQNFDQIQRAMRERQEGKIQ